MGTTDYSRNNIRSHIPSMIPLSVLDLAPVPEGSNAGQALRNSFELGRHVEALGYQRYWMAEHHNMPGIASAATAVALAHVGTVTPPGCVGVVGILPACCAGSSAPGSARHRRG